MFTVIDSFTKYQWERRGHLSTAVFCIILPFKNYFSTMLSTICNAIFKYSSIKLPKKMLKSNIYVSVNGIKFQWDHFWNEKWQGASTQNVISSLKPRNGSINSENVGSLLCSEHYLREVTTTYVQNVVHIVRSVGSLSRSHRNEPFSVTLNKKIMLALLTHSIIFSVHLSHKLCNNCFKPLKAQTRTDLTRKLINLLVDSSNFWHLTHICKL